MGYDPHRKFTARTGDYVLLAAGLLAVAALVAWGLFS